eukprot:216211_1
MILKYHIFTLFLTLCQFQITYQEYNAAEAYNTTDLSCDNGFLCIESGKCINTSSVCDRKFDCPNKEDEPVECTVCFDDFSGILSGRFEFFSYDTVSKSIIYNASINDVHYYLYHVAHAESKNNFYVIGPDHNTLSGFIAACLLATTITTPKVEDCRKWFLPNGEKLLPAVDIGCNRSCHFSCYESGICINKLKLCDRTIDCPLWADDELDCNVCIDVIDDNYLPLNGRYSYHHFDTVYNGSVYYDGIALYFYPVIYHDNKSGSYDYYYFLHTDYNEIDWPLSYCYMFLPEASTSLTLRPDYCNIYSNWFAKSRITGKFASKHINATYCQQQPSTYCQQQPSILTQTLSPTTTQTTTVVSAFNSSIDFESIPDWIDSNNFSATFYLAANGNDEVNCGSETNPCGTFWYVSQYAVWTASKIKMIESITIIIRGQNKGLLLWFNQFGNVTFNRCFPRLIIPIKDNELPLNTITFMFDSEYIHSKEDWFPSLCSDSSRTDAPEDSFFNIEPYDFMSVSFKTYDFTVIIKNCIINDWSVTSKEIKPNFIVTSTLGFNVRYVFINFTFSNNYITYLPKALIRAPQIEIYNSIFNNNTINEKYGSIFSLDINLLEISNSKQSSFIMKHNIINNMMLLGASSFVYITQNPHQA